MNTTAINNHSKSNVIITEEEVSLLLSGLVLSVASFLPASLLGVWFAHAQLAAQADSLRAPAASAGLLLSLLFIPFIHYLANKRSVGRLLCGVGICAFVVGTCVGLQ